MTLSREEIAVRMAASLLTGYASRGSVSVDRNRLACDAIHYADGLLLTLPPTPAPVAPPAGPCPGEDARDDAEARKRIAAAGLAVPPPATTHAPVAPPAGKYEPRVGDIVTIYRRTPGTYHEWWQGTVGVVEKQDAWIYLSTHRIRVKYAPNYGGGAWATDTLSLYPECVRLATDAEKRAAGIYTTPPETAPASEAKRPERVRVLGMALGEPREREVLRWTPNGDPVVKHDCTAGFTALQPREWEPAAGLAVPPPATTHAPEGSTNDAPDAADLVTTNSRWNALANQIMREVADDLGVSYDDSEEYAARRCAIEGAIERAVAAAIPAPEDDAAADARIDAILDDRKDADAIKAAAVRQRAEHRATYGPTTPAPETKCDWCGGPHVRDVFHAADITPAPEAKRPTHVRTTREIPSWSGGDRIEAGAVFPVARWEGGGGYPFVYSARGGFILHPCEWEPCDPPAPCPPPVAGSVDPVREAERAVVKAAEALQAADDAYAELYATVKDDDDAHNEARPRLDHLHAARLNRRFDLTAAVRALRTSRPVRP